MWQPQHKADIISGCHVLTQYPVEEFTLTWNITNYTKIFNIVSTQFSTSSGATSWEMRLSKSSGIELWRCFDGGPVKVYFAAALITNHGIFETGGRHVFGKRFDSCTVMKFGSRTAPIFRNDVFNFQCGLTIIGHSITSEIKSTDLEPANFKQFSCDMKDMFEKQELCDLTISVGEDKVKAHKAILCARSPVFNKMFQYSMLESDRREIEMNDIDFDVLRDFLTFLYSGELKDLSWDKASQLYYAADKYEVKGLRDTCSQFLEFNLGVDKVCNVLKLAFLHNDEKLKNNALSYVRTHFSALQATEDWQELVKTHPKLAVEAMYNSPFLT